MADDTKQQQNNDFMREVAQTQGFQAGFLAGYTKNSTDPQEYGYMQGYVAQREGADKEVAK